MRKRASVGGGGFSSVGGQESNQSNLMNASKDNASDHSKSSSKSKLGMIFANINSKIMQKMDQSNRSKAASERTAISMKTQKSEMPPLTEYKKANDCGGGGADLSDDVDIQFSSDEESGNKRYP